MSKKGIIYGLSIVVLFGIMISIQMESKPFNWTKTYSRFDKNPYGAYALSELLEGLFSKELIKKSNQTFYEVLKEGAYNEGLMTISESFQPDEQSMNAMLQHASEGGELFISARGLSFSLLDTLELELEDERTGPESYVAFNDSLAIIIDGTEYSYLSSELSSYLSKVPESAIIIATNESEHPITIIIPHGQGKIVINTTPVIFTNYFLLFEENHHASAKTLSLLKDAPVHWTEYYQVGKTYSSSPFAVILNYASLRYALYATMVLLVCFVLFEMKRKQAVIPVIVPPINQTVEFIKTLGTLYFNSANHRAPALNRIFYFKEYLSINLNMHWSEDKRFIKQLAAKSGHSENFLEGLGHSIRKAEKVSEISDGFLMRLNKQLDQFYKKRNTEY